MSHHSITLRGLSAFFSILLAGTAAAIAPALPAANSQITLNGIPLGSAIAGRSSYPTLLYASGTATYHMWVGVLDETPPGTAASDFFPLRIGGFRHATSVNGVNFTQTGALSYAGNPFATTIFGSTYDEPPWIYPKVTLWNGRYTLLQWTFNNFFGPSSFGDYNYNISINDIGPTPANRVLDHWGPLGAVPGNGIAGQSAGAFGIVEGALYYDYNSQLGRAPLTNNGPSGNPAAANTGPWRVTASNALVADPLTSLGFIACHLANGNTYLHNDARVLANGDGTLGFFFSLRNCDGSRKAQQIYYMESANNGLTWGAAVGIAPAAVTIGGQPPIGGFALADVVIVNGTRVVYFNYPVAGGGLVVGALPPVSVVPTVSIPSNGTWMLAALFAMLGLAGGFALRRVG